MTPIELKDHLLREYLLVLLEQCSEEFFSASWYRGIEFHVWRRICNGDSHPLILKIKELSNVCRGFWTLDDDSEAVFLGMEEWLKLATRKQRE
jgi:hypothetical protein